MGNQKISTEIDGAARDFFGDLLGLNTSELIKRLKKFKSFILAMALLSGALSWGVAKFLLPKEYISRATIMPRSRAASAGEIPGKLGGMLTGLGISVSGAAQDVQQLQALIRSSRLEGLAKKNLSEDPAFAGRSINYPKLKVDLQATNLILNLTATGSSPEIAQKYMAAYLEELQRLMVQNQSNQSARAVAFINERIEEVKASLDLLEDRLMKMRVADRLDASTGFDSKKPIEAQLARAKREYQIQSTVLETLSQQREIAQIETKREEQMFVTIDPPQLIQIAAGPSPKTYLIYGVLLGILLACGIALYLSKNKNFKILSKASAS